MLDTLREDFARIPALLAAEGPDQPDITVSLAEAPDEVVEALVDHVDEPAPEPGRDEPAAPEPVAMAEQMGLF
jgi:hypothetical protein